MLFPKTTDNIVYNKLLEYKELAHTQRRSEWSALYSLFKNNHQGLLQSAIIRQFQEPDDLINRMCWQNILKPIVENSATVFKRDIAITFKGGNADTAQTIWDDFSKNTLFLKTWNMVQEYAFLLNIVHIAPVFKPSGKMGVDLIYPQTTWINQKDNDPTELESIVIERCSGLDSKKHTKMRNTFWDDSEIIVFDEEYRIISQSENPYGRIPYIKVTKDLEFDKYYPEPDQGLIRASLNIDIKLTQLNLIIDYQSFNIPVITNWDGREKVHLSPANPLLLKGTNNAVHEPKVTQLENNNQNLINLWTQIKEDIQLIAKTYNIPTDKLSIRPVTKSSGTQVKLELLPILSMRKAAIPDYDKYLSQFWDMFRIVYNTHHDQKISEATQIKVDFKELDEYTSEEEIMTRREFEKRNGLKSSVDFIMEDNPGMLRKDAQAIYDANMAIYQREQQQRQGFAQNLIGGSDGN